MDNYYKEFPEIIRQDMSTEEIREKLDERNAVIGNRFDARSLEEQEKIRAALEVFRDEESRRAYDQALAQGDRKPPEEDQRQKLREEQAEWIQRAQDFCKSKDYDLAKAAMDRALEKDKDLPNGTAYRLAAQIYASAEEYAHALRCINEALLLEPENPNYIRIKGAVFGAEAWKLAKDSRFSSSPELRAKYKELRAKELAQLNNALTRARSDKMRGRVLEHLARTEYCRPDQIDAEQAERDRRAGVQHVRDAEKLGPLNSDSQKILEHFRDRCEKRRRNAGPLNELMESANDCMEDRKFNEARVAIEKALKLDADPNGRLYGLAADIYCWCGDLGAASLYIGKALALEPENPCLIAVKGQLYGEGAWKVARDDRFSSSPELREEYRELRRKELALLHDALKRESDCREKDDLRYTTVLEKLAWAEYFRPDQIDAEQGKKERRAGLQHAKAVDAMADISSAAARFILDDYCGLRSRAEDCYENGEYVQAKSWIAAVMELGEGIDCPYELAFKIYLKNNELNTALGYIDKKVARKPEYVCHIIDTGELCGREALKAAGDSRFSSSPVLRKAYRELRTKELTLLNDACKQARLHNKGDEIACALGCLAWAEYCRPDQIDRAQAERDQCAGVRHAQEAEHACPGVSRKAQTVLEKRKEELETWKKQARSHYDKKEYAQAKSAVVKALSMETASASEYLYWLAANIYLENNELDTALEYIDKALARSPEDVYNITTKGEIYGRKAERIKENSSFKTSSDLRNKYRAFLAEELALMEKAVAVAQETGDREKRAYTLGYLAWVVYFRFDITREGKLPAGDGRRAYGLACQALELGKSWRAQKVLDAEKRAQEIVEGLRRYSGR